MFCFRFNSSFTWKLYLQSLKLNTNGFPGEKFIEPNFPAKIHVKTINENKQLPSIWKSVDAPFKHIDFEFLLQQYLKLALLISVRIRTS